MNNKVAAASLLILLTLISIQHTTSFSTNLAVFPSQPDSYSLPYDLGVNETRTSDVLTPPIDDSTEPAVNKVSETVDASNINKASNEATNKSIVESENNSSIAETVDAILVLETPTIVGKWFVLAAKAYVGEKPAVDTLTFKVPITTEAAELDVYTQKGGEGANASSGPFNPGDEVELYADFTYYKDPLQSRLVLLEVVNPPGEVSLLLTITTNATGVAQTVFTVPDISGEWFVLAKAKAYVGEKPAVDTLTFKVPITTEAAELDVYTQKGGEGANASSGPFNPGEVVTLYVLFTYNGDPVQSRLVIIEVHDPDGNILLIDTIMTDEFGFATHSFRLPDLIQE